MYLRGPKHVEGFMEIFQHFNVCEYVLDFLSLKTKDTSATSWLFDFVSYFLARYKNEKKKHVGSFIGIFSILMCVNMF